MTKQSFKGDLRKIPAGWDPYWPTEGYLSRGSSLGRLDVHPANGPDGTTYWRWSAETNGGTPLGSGYAATARDAIRQAESTARRGGPPRKRSYYR